MSKPNGDIPNSILNLQFQQSYFRLFYAICLGDGRNDSPGHCAKFCTYSMMDQTNKAIVAVEVVDKRETNLKSPNMEALGLQKAMRKLQVDHTVHIKEITTDAHVQIRAKLSKWFLYLYKLIVPK